MTVVTMLMMLALAGEGGAASAADSILTRYVEALGGQVAIGRVEARSYRGNLIHDINWHDPPRQEIPFVADHRGKGTFRYVESDNPADLLGVKPEDEGHKLDWLLHPQSALAVAEYFPDLEITDRKIRDGRPVVVLESPHLPTAYWALYFDENTGLLNHIGHYWDLEDYREVDGVLFAHRLVTSRKGGSSTYVFSRVVSEFRMNRGE